MVEASPRRVFANAHTYHINSVSVNSDNETYLSADDLRINLWHLEITDRSFSILECIPPHASPPEALFFFLAQTGNDEYFSLFK